MEIAKQAVAAGQTVVIGLQTTGEASVDQQRSDRAGIGALRSELANLKKSWASNEAVEDAAGSSDSDEEEFASAPAQVLKRLICKLFPLPEKPGVLVRAEAQERQRRDLASCVRSQTGRLQRNCATAYRESLRPYEERAQGGGGTDRGRGLKRKNRGPRSDGFDDEEVAWSEDDDESLSRRPAKKPAVGGRPKKSHTLVVASDDEVEEDTGASSGRAQESQSSVYEAEAEAGVGATPPLHGTGDGINGWSIFETEGWVLVDNSDHTALERAVRDALEAMEGEVSEETASEAMREASAGARFVNRRVQKTFRRTVAEGWVVAYLPNVLNDGEGELWHVVFQDGDEEDWSEDEVNVFV